MTNSHSPTSTSAPGKYLVKNGKSGLCMGVSGGSTLRNATMAQFTCSDSNASQHWIFMR
jgi:hypothetical protein